MDASVIAMATPIPPSNPTGGGRTVQTPMPPNPFYRIAKATLETPGVLIYASVIVTILTVVYWLLGG